MLRACTFLYHYLHCNSFAHACSLSVYRSSRSALSRTPKECLICVRASGPCARFSKPPDRRIGHTSSATERGERCSSTAFLSRHHLDQVARDLHDELWGRNHTRIRTPRSWGNTAT